MSADPFTPSQPPREMSFAKLVFGVAFGVILSQLIVAGVVFLVYLAIEARLAPERKARAEQRLREAEEKWDETMKEIRRLDERRPQDP